MTPPATHFEILDLTQIPVTLSALRSMSMFFALAATPFFAVLEAIRLGVSAIRSEVDFADAFSRTMIAFVVLIMYDKLFLIPVTLFQDMSDVVYPINVFVNDITNISTIAAQHGQDVGFFKFGVITILNTLLAAQVGVLTPVFENVQYVLLGLLYFLGPLACVTIIFKPTSYVIGGLVRWTVSVSMWGFILRVLFKVFATVAIYHILSLNGSGIDLVELAIADTTFIVLLLSTPAIAHLLVTGQAMSGLGAGAGFAVGRLTNLVTPAVGKAATGLGFLKPSTGTAAPLSSPVGSTVIPASSITKTEQRDLRQQARQPKSNDTDTPS